ncbi:putative membrane protein [Halorubrum sp. AJ67]|nr:putative membrane protein [Halorubrum sp. AJ67]
MNSVSYGILRYAALLVAIWTIFFVVLYMTGRRSLLYVTVNAVISHNALYYIYDIRNRE